MTARKGGRGHKAPYETKQMRVPVPVQDKVREIVKQFHRELEGEETQDLKSSIKELDEAIKLAKSITRQKKSARISMAKLLSGIYGVSITPEDLK